MISIKKIPQSKAIVRTHAMSALWKPILGDEIEIFFRPCKYFWLFHHVEVMDLGLKRIEISRTGNNGLICKDNMRADIKVAFFVQVNKTKDDVKRVAQSVGCARASDPEKLFELFDAKFSEALKTVGKHFEFTELYNSREDFKTEILKIIGRDLNGYLLDDAAIDYLEQTPKEVLSPDNILDAEGIKKITDITAHEAVLANNIEREKEKTITKQNVEAEEAILQLNRQLEEKKAIQQREVKSIQAREEAETKKVQSEERNKSEQARIAADEEIEVSQQNKERQVIVAMRSKERTDAVETERVNRDRDLEINERERIVTIAQISKEKEVETEKKNIQEVIRERVIVEKAVVEEEEAIKTTKATAQADREKTVALTKAEEEAQEALIVEVKRAQAAKEASELEAQKVIIVADAEQESSSKRAEAMKTLADARAAEEAVAGLAEANVLEAKARAHEKEGEAQAKVVERMAGAEAKGIEVKAEAKRKDGAAEADVHREIAKAEAEGMMAKVDAKEKEGTVEADIMAKKYKAEAEGITQKAEAMKKLDGVGKEHEEFKLRLAKDKEVELAGIDVHRDIARAQADVLGEALKSASIEIIGGEPQFFDRIAGSVARGKSLDRFVSNSDVLNQARELVLGGEAGEGIDKIRSLISETGVQSSDVRNLTLSALLLKMMSNVEGNSELENTIKDLMGIVSRKGLNDQPAASFLKE